MPAHASRNRAALARGTCLDADLAGEPTAAAGLRRAAPADMRFVLLAPLVVLASSLTDAAPTVDKAPEQRFEEGMLLRFHMHENYGIVRAIERLLLRGRLEDARPLAAAIGEAPDESGMSAFAKHSAEVRRRALDLSLAKTVDEFMQIFENYCRAQDVKYDRSLVEDPIERELMPRHVHLRRVQPRGPHRSCARHRSRRRATGRTDARVPGGGVRRLFRRRARARDRLA